jgi:hypothetical protein
MVAYTFCKGFPKLLACTEVRYSTVFVKLAGVGLTYDMEASYLTYIGRLILILSGTM